MAITAEMMIKNAMKILSTESLLFSPMGFLFAFLSCAGTITSRVSVELEVSTSEESVDIDAASTRTITTATITG